MTSLIYSKVNLSLSNSSFSNLLHQKYRAIDSRVVGLISVHLQIYLLVNILLSMEINKHMFFGTKKLHTLIATVYIVLALVVAEIFPPFTLKWVAAVGAADALLLCAGGQRNCLNLLKAHF